MSGRAPDRARPRAASLPRTIRHRPEGHRIGGGPRVTGAADPGLMPGVGRFAPLGAGTMAAIPIFSSPAPPFGCRSAAFTPISAPHRGTARGLGSLCGSLRSPSGVRSWRPSAPPPPAAREVLRAGSFARLPTGSPRPRPGGWGASSPPILPSAVRGGGAPTRLLALRRHLSRNGRGSADARRPLGKSGEDARRLLGKTPHDARPPLAKRGEDARHLLRNRGGVARPPRRDQPTRGRVRVSIALSSSVSETSTPEWISSAKSSFGIITHSA